MSVAQKAFSALRLLGRFDFAAFGRQWRRHQRQTILRRQGAAPFVHTGLGFPVVCHPDWPDSAEQYLDGHSDGWEFRLLQAWLSPGDLFLDLGANTGLYSFAAVAAVGPAGRVLAVDAAPEVTRRLAVAANVPDAPRFQVVQAAVTETSGTVTFHVQPGGVNTAEQSLHAAAGSVPVSVPARSLSDLAREQGFTHPPAAIKMDIEGAEPGALAGAPARWFEADGPLWIVEINPEALARFAAKPADLLARFPAGHFDGWLLPKHPLDPSARPALRRPAPADPLTDSRYYNFFAVPRGAVHAARAARLAPFLPAA